MQRLTVKKDQWLVIAVGENPERIGPRHRSLKTARSWAANPERQLKVLSANATSRVVYVERLDATSMACTN